MLRLGLLLSAMIAVFSVPFMSACVKKPAPIIWATADNATVIMDGFAYNPPKLAVAVGTNVTWINKYPIAHRVTSNGSSPNFTSPSLNTGGSFTFTFDQTGNYSYYCGCGIHPDMKGEIIVLK